MKKFRGKWAEIIAKTNVATQSAKPEDKRNILRICNETSCDILSLPGMYQLYIGEVTVSKMKLIQIVDLLGRDPIKPDMAEVFECIRGKAVLIIGHLSIQNYPDRLHHISRNNSSFLIFMKIILMIFKWN